MSAVVSFSGGLSSFGSAVRAVERFGRDNVTLLFADVKQEDSDCYRFLGEAAEALKLPLEITADGRTPWDVAHDEGFIPNNRVPLCSRLLKHEPTRRWLDLNAPDALVVMGIAWHEEHRVAANREGHLPREAWYPMCEPPYLDNDSLSALSRSYGVEPPRMYKAGYAHANCAGACFRAGHAAWRLLLQDSPDLFQWHEWQEHHWRRTWGRDNTVLKWRTKERDGQPMSLQTLRRLVEAKREDQLDLDEWGGCGCTPGDSGGVLLTIGSAA